MRAHINFSSVIGKIEAMYGWSRVNVKVEPRSTLKFTSSLSYIAPIMIFKRGKIFVFTHVKIARQWELSLWLAKILNTKTSVARQSTKVKINYIYKFLLDFEVKYKCPRTRKSAQVR